MIHSHGTISWMNKSNDKVIVQRRICEFIDY
jgi:hypothetical protein